MWGCGRSPHPHIYRSSSLGWPFFSALNDNLTQLKITSKIDLRVELKIGSFIQQVGQKGSSNQKKDGCEVSQCSLLE